MRKLTVYFSLRICCFFKNLAINYFTFTALHSADKFSKELQILGLIYYDTLPFGRSNFLEETSTLQQKIVEKYRKRDFINGHFTSYDFQQIICNHRNKMVLFLFARGQWINSFNEVFPRSESKQKGLLFSFSPTIRGRCEHAIRDPGSTRRR